MPQYKVEIAFDSGYSTPAASRTWTDVSAYVEGDQPLTISRGRADELAQVDASRLTLTLDNSDGRFTPELTSGAYYPNVKKGRPIRVTARYNAVDYVRFVGYVDEWPVSWPDAVDGRSLVTITAASRMARLGRVAELRSVPEEELYKTSSPSLYYKLNEGSGATTASDSAGVTANGSAVVEVNLGGTVTFGSDIGAFGDGYTAPRFTCPGTAAGVEVARLTARNHGLSLNLRDVCFSAFINIHDTTADVAILTIGANPGDTGVQVGLQLYVDSSQALTLVLEDGATQYTLATGAAAIQPNTTHHVALAMAGDGAASICVDGGALYGKVPGFFPSVPLAGPAVTLGVGTSNGFARSITISHAALGALMIPWATHGSAIQAIAEAGLTGFAGESVADRFRRYAGYAGIPTNETSALPARAATVAAFDIAGSTPLDMLRKLAETTDGVVYDSGAGLLSYRDGARRYNIPSSFTLDAASGQVEADVEPRLDDQFLVNDFTASGLGMESRVIDQDSIDDYGIYRQSGEVLSDNRTDLDALAQWRVGLGSEPRLRYSTVAVDVVNSSTSQAAAILNADIGTRFSLSNLPSQAPASTADLFVEGYAETLTATSHGIAFNTSPTYGYAGSVGVWQLDVNSLDGPNILAL